MRTIGAEKSGRTLGYVGVAAALAISGFASMSALLSTGVIETRTPVGGSARAAQSADPPTGSVAAPAALTGSAVANAEQTFPLGPPVVHQAPEPPSQAELAKTRARNAEDEPRARSAESFRARARSARSRDRDMSADFGRLHTVR
jgi:hypothetical protein